MKKSELRKIIKEEISRVLTEEKYSNDRTNFRDKEITSGVINHYFDTIDIIDINDNYKIKIISTYWFRDPGVAGYSNDNSEENPRLFSIKTTLIDPSGKSIKNHNFTGNNQWFTLMLGKEHYIPYVTNWWIAKLKSLNMNTKIR